jgi:hypothetical protein
MMRGDMPADQPRLRRPQAAPSAHRGFLNRARAVPIESLYHLACRRGRRLVLTGALRWRRQLPVWQGRAVT